MDVYFDEINDTEEDNIDDEYKTLKEIGSGSFGTVVHAIYRKSGENVAIKIINKNNHDSEALKKLRQEVIILNSIKCQYIVEFKNFIETKNKIYIIMEYIKYGTLKDLIKKKKKHENLGFTEFEVSKFLKCLFSALEYLHRKEIVHRDIKPENILVQDDLTDMKLIDFGLSAQYFEQKEEFDFCGTLIYMAPEQVEKTFYSKSIDVWSCGIIMYILLNNGKHPLYKKGDTKKEYIKKLVNPKWEFVNKISIMAIDLLGHLMNVNRSYRYSFSEALKHPFITRRNIDRIPLPYIQVWKNKEIKTKFRHVFIKLI